MSCSYGAPGFQCNKIYTLGGAVSLPRATEMYNLGKDLGLTDFNPTSVDWDTPVSWKGATGTIMDQGAGWGLMIGFGLGLTVITVILTYMVRMANKGKETSEDFNTAGRSVKTGLTASVIVSQWTWAATLLQSSNVAWQYGITGPFWYASGATIQILLFGILAVEVKRSAPNAHTFLEIVKVRWGTAAHMTFLCFGMSANLIVSAMLLLGGCATFEAVSGVSIYASSFVIPLLTLIYTLVGGLKATFLAGYVHTCMIMIILVVFITYVYGVENDCTDTDVSCVSLGSANVVYERLMFMTSLPTRKLTAGNLTVHQGPANTEGKFNRQGTYLTMMSEDGLSFGVINIIGNFGTVFVDQSYWQSAIAATPQAAHKGYILGGFVWFTIPFALGTALGLAGNALNVAITAGEAGNGLVPPASAIALLGPAGGIAVMIQLTMAILSTGSAECIAVSSLWSYDIYRTYFNPKATGKQIVMYSRIFVCIWAVIMGCISIILYELNIGLGWVYNFMATVLGSAVAPIAMCIYTNKLDATFAVAGAGIGCIGAVTVWLAYASTLGPLDKNTTGNLYAQLYGGLTALLLSFIICMIGCIVKPQNFDWEIMRTGITLVGGDGGENSKVLGEDESHGTVEALAAAKAWILKWGLGSTIFLVILWPLFFVPMGTFGKSTFQLWAGIALMWGYTGTLIIILLPLYESMDGMMAFFCRGNASTTKAIPTESSSAVA